MSQTSEETTSVASARIRLLDSPPAMPGKCAICGVSEDPVGFIDPQLDFEFYGSVFFCASNCAGSLVERLGWISPVRAQMLIQSALDLNARVLALHEKLESLGDLDVALRNYVANHSVPIVDDLDSLGVPADLIIEPGTPEVAGTISEPEQLVDEVSSDAAEPVSVKGSDDIPNVGVDDIVNSVLGL